ncbi:MAG: amidohydrolase family protein [Chloroflexi bacterium]|nr:amidohydrolase family protein [Chloroflexota bacterium]MBU1878326.1 amidohydrolase family protein [Chloroflexota bacterium]
MIVDMHVHLFPTQEVGKQIVTEIQETYGAGYHSYGTPDEYLADMARAGIDYGVMVSFAPDHQLKNTNFWTTAITRPKKSGPAAYPMLIPFVSVSPTMKGRTPVEELEFRLKWGMRGVKIHPIAQGFAPDDERMWPVYQWLVARNLPILTHSGINVVENEQTDLARPRRWLPALKDFPSLRLILAHMGGGFWDEAIDIVRTYPQVMLDTAIALTAVELRNKNWLDDTGAVEMIRAVGADHVLFGSDYPWIDPAGDVARIRSLPLTDGEIRLILGENAARILRLAG